MKKLLIAFLIFGSVSVAKADPIATEITITGVEMNSKTSVKITCEMYDIYAGSRVLVETTSPTFQFIRFDALNQETKAPYTQDERVENIKAQFSEWAEFYIASYRGGLGDFTKYVQQLNGLTVSK